MDNSGPTASSPELVGEAPRTLSPVDDQALAQSIAYALKKHRKLLQRLDPRDDEAHRQAALRIVQQLRLSGIETSRQQSDLSMARIYRGHSESDG